MACSQSQVLSESTYYRPASQSIAIHQIAVDTLQQGYGFELGSLLILGLLFLFETSLKRKLLTLASLDSEGQMVGAFAYSTVPAFVVVLAAWAIMPPTILMIYNSKSSAPYGVIESCTT